MNTPNAPLDRAPDQVLLRELVRGAIAAPSVHNTQPARWRIEGNALIVLEDLARRLPVGDPAGHDANISLGAAIEGISLAASLRGLSVEVERLSGTSEGLRHVARLTFALGAKPDPLAQMLSQRASWRGAFHVPTDEARAHAAALAGEDRTLLTDPAAIMALADLYDTASLGFLRDPAFRAELVSWMRLGRSHPGWARDGLNAHAMGLSRIEALGAGAVLGPLFGPLDTIGAAAPLLAEKGSFAGATGVILFHRPASEAPLISGRHFHRVWLEIDALGFGANVLAAIADDTAINAAVMRYANIPTDQRLVSAFRFGLRKGSRFAPARLPLDEVLLG